MGERTIGARLLFVGFGAMALAQCSGWAGGAPAGGAMPFNPVASVGQVMGGIVIPGSQAVFDAVVYSNGELVQVPRTDDDWFRVRMQALAVAEAGNLLLMPPRARDGEWIRFAQAMTERAAAAASAAEAKDVDQLLAAGSELYATCTACHAAFLMEQP